MKAKKGWFVKCDGAPLSGKTCSQKATRFALLPFRFGKVRGSKLFSGCPYHWQLMGLVGKYGYDYPKSK